MAPAVPLGHCARTGVGFSPLRPELAARESRRRLQRTRPLPRESAAALLVTLDSRAGLPPLADPPRRGGVAVATIPPQFPHGGVGHVPRRLRRVTDLVSGPDRDEPGRRLLRHRGTLVGVRCGVADGTRAPFSAARVDCEGCPRLARASGHAVHRIGAPGGCHVSGTCRTLAHCRCVPGDRGGTDREPMGCGPAPQRSPTGATRGQLLRPLSRALARYSSSSWWRTVQSAQTWPRASASWSSPSSRQN